MTDHFLQSKEWEEFQKSVGREVFRVGDVLLIKFPLALGKSYLYSAGAVPDSDGTRRIAKEEGAIFLKCEPLSEDKGLTDKMFGAGFIKSEKEIQPQKTLVLDLAKQGDELLADMHEKTRYNIRLCARKGVTVQNSKTSNGDIFWKLLQKTRERDGFSTHAREYYEGLLKLPTVRLFTAEYQGEIIAANMILFYGDTAYYLHGASDYEYRNLMAPYLLHWEIIRYAKEDGFAKYDLWGIDEQKWPGVTRFKRGFGGREVTYIGPYDYVFQSMWNRLYLLRNRLR